MGLKYCLMIIVLLLTGTASAVAADGSIPTLIFMVFQMTFACIFVVIILGSAVDRMKFAAWIVFALLWITFVRAGVQLGVGRSPGGRPGRTDRPGQRTAWRTGL